MSAVIHQLVLRKRAAAAQARADALARDNIIAAAKGAPGLVWRGAWSKDTEYAVWDAVSRNGSSHIAVAPSVGDGPPGSAWDLLASAGAAGKNGRNGKDGAIISVGVSATPAPPVVSPSFAPINFSYGDVSVRTIHTLLDDAVISNIELVIEIPYNGAESTLMLRTNGGDELMLTSDNQPSLVATFETSPQIRLSAGSIIELVMSTGAGCTEGSGFILLNIE